MKRIFQAMLPAAGLFLILSLLAKAGEIPVGQTAPNFTLTDTYGNNHSLSDCKGKTVVLEWINHDCPFVVKLYNSGKMQELQRTYTGKGVIWLSINSSAPGKQGFRTPEEANELTRQKKAAPTALLLDSEGEVGKLYAAKTTPHMFIINKDGVLVYNGAIDDIRSTNIEDIARAKNYVQLALDELLAGKEVSIKTTQPYGCSVKYK